MSNEQERNGEAQGSVPAERRPRPLSWLTLIVVAGLVFILYTTFAPLTLPGQQLTIEIAPGQGSRAIAEGLKDQGLIRSRALFIIYTTLTGRAGKLKPGRYEFGPSVSLPAIVHALVAGERNEILLTVPEGWDLRDLGRHLESRALYPAERLWAATGLPAADYRSASGRPPDFSTDFDFLGDKPASVGLEGYLFPDTYRLFRASPPESLLGKMLSNFDAKLTAELRAEIERQGKTIFAVITMASLLEKEVPDAADRRLVSGILWRRLRAGIPLQVDAAVNYITARHKTPSADDLALDSPFNTYRHPGLPLGPIANPGLAAIRAAIFPERSEYLYYLSTPDGRTVFSKTLPEHAAAKARYLR